MGVQLFQCHQANIRTNIPSASHTSSRVLFCQDTSSHTEFRNRLVLYMGRNTCRCSGCLTDTPKIERPFFCGESYTTLSTSPGYIHQTPDSDTGCGHIGPPRRYPCVSGGDRRLHSLLHSCILGRSRSTLLHHLCSCQTDSLNFGCGFCSTYWQSWSCIDRRSFQLKHRGPGRRDVPRQAQKGQVDEAWWPLVHVLLCSFSWRASSQYFAH